MLQCGRNKLLQHVYSLSPRGYEMSRSAMNWHAKLFLLMSCPFLLRTIWTILRLIYLNSDHSGQGFLSYHKFINIYSSTCCIKHFSRHTTSSTHLLLWSAWPAWIPNASPTYLHKQMTMIVRTTSRISSSTIQTISPTMTPAVPALTDEKLSHDDIIVSTGHKML